ncbi:hypothetical protein [Bradyrhizobium diazoefficiens]
MADLALREPSCLCHFIRRDHQTPLQSGDAKTLLLNVGKQFSRCYPDIFATEQVQIEAKVVSRRVKSLGEVVGAKIGSLIANPFRATSIAATVEVEEVEGRVASVEIERLIEDGRLLPVADLLRMGLLDPLTKLERRGSGERITILIDALDETRFSQGPDDAISFLSTLPELPGNVRIIATSRPDAAIADLLRRDDVRHIPLDRGDLHDENSSTMSTLIRASTGNLGPEFVQSLVAKAQGNFLYARLVLSSLGRDVQPPEALALLEKVPVGLQKLFAYFISALVRSCEEGRLGKKCWHRLLAPVLGVLAVARQPLSRDSLMNFAGLSVEETANVLREVGQFVLNRPGQDGVRVYGIFHSSFSEYLLDLEANQEWSLDGARAHRRIADWALQHWGTLEASLPKLPISGGRSSSESYALDHLPFHLSAAAATSELKTLLTEFVWCAARLTSSGSAGLLADFQLVATQDFERLTDCVYLSISALHDRRPGALAGQLLGRLQNTETRSPWRMFSWRGRTQTPIERLLKGARRYDGEAWLRPLRRSLIPPAGHLRQTHRFPAGIRSDGVGDSIAISSDGKFAVGCNYEKVIRWDLRTGAISICEARNGPCFVTASPDGRFCSWREDDEKVVIYDWLSGQRVFDRKFDLGTLWQIEFSHKADFVLAAGSEGGVLISVHNETYENLPFLRAPFALTPDSHSVLYANADTTISVRELRSGRLERTLSPLGEYPQSLQMTASGKKVIAAGGGKSLEDPGCVGVWDLTAGTESSVRRWAPSICGFGELPNGELVALDLNHGELALWLWPSQSKMVLDTMAIDAALTPDALTLVSFDGQGNMKVWDTPPFAPSPEFNLATTQVGAVTFSRRGTTFASVNYEGTKVWRAHDGSLLRSYPGTSYLEYRSVSADGRFVAFLDEEHRVARAETRNGMSWRLKHDSEDLHPYEVVMSESGAEIAALDVSLKRKERRVRVMLFDSATPRSSVLLQSEAVSAIALSPDGKRLFIVVGKCLSIWDVRRGVRLSDMILPDEVYSPLPSCFTRIGVAVVCCSGGRILVVDTKKKVISEMKVDDGFIGTVGLSEDGATALISKGSVVTALDVRARKKLAEMDLGTRISSAAISPDGKTIVLGDGIGNVHILGVVKGGVRGQRTLSLESILT